MNIDMPKGIFANLGNVDSSANQSAIITADITENLSSENISDNSLANLSDINKPANFVNSTNHPTNKNHPKKNKLNTKSLEEAVNRVQKHMTEKHSELASDISKTDVFKSYIGKYIESRKIEVIGFNKDKLISRIYAEMREESILTPYLHDKNVEEININSWDDIKITYSDGLIKRCDEMFFNPTHASDVISRILIKSKMIFDEAIPFAVGHLGTNKRVTALGYGIIDRDKGVALSIRFVNPKNFTKDDFIAFGSATEEMMDFLLYSYKYNISMCFAGATSSGKTTLMSLMLNEVPFNKRLVTIEGGCREFDCVKRDNNGFILNNVIHLITKESEKENQNVTQRKLLQLALTLNPNYIAVAEMKGEESFEAVSAANTGHSVITTIHSNSCKDTYARMVVLCKMLYMMDDNTLMGLTTSAFPIVAYCKQLDDNSRHIMEIAECEGIKDGYPIVRTLFRYKILSNITNIDGSPKITGTYEKINNPSDNLLTRLKENGMPEDIYIKLFGE